jgi:peptidase S41-like protein
MLTNTLGTDLAQGEPPVLLKDVLRETGDLSLSRQERLLLVEQALALLEMTYIHLPQKRAMYAVDPVQRLRLIKYRIEQAEDDDLPDARAFHNEMLEIFTLVRDLHTNYLLVAPYSDKTAYLPFLIEEYFDERNESHFIVTRVADGIPHKPPFGVGVEILYWNGVPIQRAVELNGDRQAGSNADARYQRGIQRLTIRPLQRSLPPDEEWVTLRYRTQDKEEYDAVYNWYVAKQPPEMRVDQKAKATGESLAFGFDVQWAQSQEVRKQLYSTQTARNLDKMSKADRLKVVGKDAVSKYDSTLALIFGAKKLPTPKGAIGYIRVYSFMHPDANEFVAEFNRLMNVLPQAGLVIDVRGNGGGNILASERLLQLLTPKTIEPARFQFINSPLTLALARRYADLNVWADSIAQSVETGTLQSLAFPITTPESLELVRTIYQPKERNIVLITDALCYSATDIFAAGFQDHAIGKILGTSGNTGAGGANVWTHSDLTALVSRLDSSNPMHDLFKPLPGGAEMRVAIRRCLRVGKNAGIPVEDLGIRPDRRHQLTKNDVLHKNADLLAAAEKLLWE